MLTESIIAVLDKIRGEYVAEERTIEPRAFNLAIKALRDVDRLKEAEQHLLEVTEEQADTIIRLKAELDRRKK